jgi:hypothetical protein
VDRKVTSIKPISQKLTQTFTQLQVETIISPEMKSARKLASKGAKLLSSKGIKVPKAKTARKILSKTEVFQLDGTEQVKDSDSFAIGRVRVRTAWSEDGQTLIHRTHLHTQQGSGTLLSTRYLEDENTMVYSVQLTLDDGTEFEEKKRIFRRKHKEEEEDEDDA